MKKIFVVLLASALGLAMAAHATDATTNVTTKQEQVKKLRMQADKAHKKGEALTAKADKLQSDAAAKDGEKMRSARDPSDGASSQSAPSPYKPSPRNVGTGVRG